jgi:hypothetical protein
MHIAKTLLVSPSPCLLVFLCVSVPLWLIFSMHRPD